MTTKVTTDIFKQRVKNIHGDKYTVLGEYVNQKTKVKVKCNQCGNIWDVNPVNFTYAKKPTGCPECYKANPKTKMLSQEDFLKKLHHYKGDKFTPQEPYKGASVKMKFKCNTCDYIWATTPSNLYRWGCPKCSTKTLHEKQKLSNTEFLKRLHAMYDDEYTPLEECKGRKVAIDLIHNKCGRKVHMTPDSLLAGQGCIYCGHERTKESRSLTNTEFLTRLKEKHGDDYTALEPYKGMSEPIKFKHSVCENVFNMRPASLLLDTQGCPQCSKEAGAKKRTLTNDEFLQKLSEKGIEDIVPLEAYKGYDTKIRFRHLKCNRTFEKTPHDILAGEGCVHCFKEHQGEEHRMSNEEFQLRLNKRFGKNVYTLIGDYQGTDKLVKVFHTGCKQTVETTGVTLLSGGGCPICSTRQLPWGERTLITLFKDLGITYEFQKTFPECKHQKVLPFDFYLPRYNLLVEYDGKQHYQKVDYFEGTGDNNFAGRQLRDNIKNEYAKKNHIKLIRLTYRQNSYDKICKRLIKLLKVWKGTDDLIQKIQVAQDAVNAI